MIRTNPRDKLRKKDDKIRYIFINEWLDFVLTCSLCKGPRAKFNSIKINLKVNMILVFFKLNIKEERLRKEIFFSFCSVFKNFGSVKIQTNIF